MKPFKGRDLPSPGDRVEVYVNLNTGNLSVRQGGLVVARAERVCVDNASFVVQQGGRQRAVEGGQRNVHAFVRGAFANPSDSAGGGEPFDTTRSRPDTSR